MLSLLQRLNEWDQWLFQKINTGLANPVFDVVMPFMRESLHWLPLYLFLITFMMINFKSRGRWWVLLFLVTAALTDMTGTYGFKHVFERVRPCGDPIFSEHVRLVLKECNSGPSFISNHAANHFGMAVFFYMTMRKILRGWAIAGLCWAAIIAFAQVYVGIHYPFDVLAGALLGAGFGLITGSVYNKQFGIAIFDSQPASNKWR